MGRLTSHGESWAGDWTVRLHAELAARRAPSLHAFASEHGLVTYADIAAALDGPFAPVQILTAMRHEWARLGRVQESVAEVLWRYLSQYVRAPATDRNQRERQMAAAFGAWEAAIGSANGEAITIAINRLRESILAGWLPASADDPKLVEALQQLRWTL